jgi:hypothetical protein
MRASDWLSAGWMPDIPPLVDQSQPEDSQPRGGQHANDQRKQFSERFNVTNDDEVVSNFWCGRHFQACFAVGRLVDNAIFGEFTERSAQYIPLQQIVINHQYMESPSEAGVVGCVVTA